MIVTVSGKQITIANEISLLDFLIKKGMNPDCVVVEHNRKIIEKNDLSKTFLQENSTLEVLRFVGGGQKVWRVQRNIRPMMTG